jgi:hypothetical protein
VLRRCAAALLLVLTVAACEEHTVAIRFDPEVGDHFRFRSEIETEVTRTIDGDRDVERDVSRLEATETITEVAEDEVGVAVTVQRDGAPVRSYTVRFDRTGRLSTIDLVEGVPTEALGLDLATDLPADIASPPGGRLEPGATWAIDRRVTVEDRTVTITGSGRIDALGVEDGRAVAVAVVELSVPLRSVVQTPDGRVTLRGTQRSHSRTTYDLDDGTARADRTRIQGDVEVLVEPPEGIEAPPVPGSVRYDVRSETRRIRSDPGGG